MADSNNNVGYVAGDGSTYPDEFSAVMDQHPNIPPELKRVYITKPNIEDRRDEPQKIDWPGIKQSLENYITDAMPAPLAAKMQPYWYDQPVVPENDLSKDLGYEEIKAGNEIGDAPFNSPYRLGVDIYNTSKLLGTAAYHLIKGTTDPDQIKPPDKFDASTPLEDIPFSKGTDVGNRIVNRLLGTGGETRYQLWPERAVRSIMDDLDTVKQGSDNNESLFVTDPDTGKQGVNPKLMNAVTSLSMNVVGGPAPLAGKLADGTLGSFAGVSSKSIDKNKLDLARFLETKWGASPDKVFEKTGMFRGADDKWRYEIDDSKASFDRDWSKTVDKPDASIHPLDNIEGAKPLGEILDHPELYEAYPQLRYMPIHYDKNLTGIAHYDGADKSIHMGGRAVESFNQQGILMHEIQHAIQDIEGFAKGGSPGKAGEHYNLKFDKDFEENILKPASDLLDKMKDFGLSDHEMEVLRYYDYVIRRYQVYRKAGDEKAYENYMRLAGEAEARNVDNRLLMNKEDRKALSPAMTQDIDSPNQIVIPRAKYTSPYGIVDPKEKILPIRSYNHEAHVNYKADNLDTGVIPQPGNYGRAINNQRIKQLEDKGIKIQTKDFQGWDKIAQEEGHKIGSFNNAYKAAKNYSKSGKYTMLIDRDGKRTTYYNGRRWFTDLYRDMK